MLITKIFRRYVSKITKVNISHKVELKADGWDRITLHKSKDRIPTNICYRNSMRFATNIVEVNRIKKTHVWCAKFCKERCMRVAVNNCLSESKGFKNKCKDKCFHVNPTPNINPDRIFT